MTDTKKETWQDRRDRLAIEQADHVVEVCENFGYPICDEAVSALSNDIFNNGFNAGRRDALAEAEEILVKALEFYADYMNYSIDYDTNHNGFTRRCILYSDIEERNESSGLAGQRARKSLSAWKKARGG